MEEKAWFQALLTGREHLQLFVPLTGSCQFVRRNVVEELGGWDENSLTEDVEFALRMVEKKHLIKYAPDVCSGQETPSTMRPLFKQRVRWYRGYMETAIKYGRLLDNLNKRTIDAEDPHGGTIHDGCVPAKLHKLVLRCIIPVRKQPRHQLHWASNSFNSCFLGFNRRSFSCFRKTDKASEHPLDTLHLCLLAYADVHCRLGISETSV